MYFFFFGASCLRDKESITIITATAASIHNSFTFTSPSSITDGFFISKHFRNVPCIVRLTSLLLTMLLTKKGKPG